jgi:aminoglycoside 3-N-acetyltransferase
MESIFDYYLNQFDIQQGDTLFISSDIVELFEYEYRKTHKMPRVNELIDALIAKVGPEGTLIVPTYNWGFCKGETFDWEKTPCKTGSIGTTCLKRKDFKRTKHPIYSCAVYGKDQDYLCSIDYKSSFGSDSVFAYLDKHHAKNLIIGMGLKNSFTFMHYSEQLSGKATYRYIKDFTADYIDEHKEKSTRTYSMFVRDLDLDVQNMGVLLEPELQRLGVLEVKYINDIKFVFLPDMHDAVAPIVDDITNNRGRKIVKYIGQ